jgi:hypothetical protein
MTKKERLSAGEALAARAMAMGSQDVSESKSG